VGAGAGPLEAMGVSGRPVLVTGGYGLIGAWLVRALLQRGVPMVLIRRDEPAASTLELLGLAGRVDVVPGDICDAGLVARVVAEYEVESVFHLAAQTLVGPAHRAPAATFETNIRGTWVVLEACRAGGVERVVVASSDKAYGAHDKLPYTEDHALLARYPYDASKAACDVLSRSYWHSFGLPVAVTRLANVYGGGDTNRSRLIPESVCAAHAGRAPVLRSDGSPERDFLYVEDAAAAYLAVWDALGRGHGRGEAFNAGSGEPHRVSDVVALICRLAGSEVAPVMARAGTPAGEIDRQWLDSSKLRALTGWEPRVTLEEGLARTIEWYREHAF
jgi:CDP-glucose 4,6-dehydratase